MAIIKPDFLISVFVIKILDFNSCFVIKNLGLKNHTNPNFMSKIKSKIKSMDKVEVYFASFIV